LDAPLSGKFREVDVSARNHGDDFSEPASVQTSAMAQPAAFGDHAR
jgi:hypothetical protein